MAFLHILLTLPLLFSLFRFNVAKEQCSQGTGSHHGFVLRGHVFYSFTAERLALCYSACNTNPACQSLNFNLADKTCEFNSEFNKSRPQSLMKSEVHVYADNPDRGEWYILRHYVLGFLLIFCKNCGKINSTCRIPSLLHELLLIL